MYLLIVLIPLISASIAGLAGRTLGEKGAGLFTCTCLIISVLLAWIIGYEIVVAESSITISLWYWMVSDLVNVSFALQFDSLTCIMLIVVTSVSALVHIYSTSYMAGDPHIPRFMSYLSLFTFFMIVLVTSNNFIQLFIGWEGVGLCSYLLINFWYTGLSNNKCAVKAMIVNRIGDMGLLLAMFAIWVKAGSLDFPTVFSFVTNSQDGWDLICILILVGAVGKSAQLGLHTWLPDAMAGPTPVSALIHAATMVTAGVFIIIRSSPLFEAASVGLIVVTIIGALTAFFAATIGLFQNDIKKIVAYSTCSQLGYMVVACGVSNYSTSLFHLVNHAFFKALLFLSAGSVIHAVVNDQDIRRLGGTKLSLPLTYTMILIGSLSLMGFPFLTGFYSKDFMLEATFGKHYISFAYWLTILAALLTAFYSFRLIYVSFFGGSNLPRQSFKQTHEGDWRLTAPLIILAIGSIGVGYFTKDLVLGLTFIPIIPITPKLLPLIFTVVGATIAVLLYKYYTFIIWNITHSKLIRHIYGFINAAWQFDLVAYLLIVKHVVKFSNNVSYKLIDRGLLEQLGPTGLSKTVVTISQLTSRLQSGLIFNYALIIIIFLVVFTLI